MKTAQRTESEYGLPAMPFGHGDLPSNAPTVVEHVFVKHHAQHTFLKLNSQSSWTLAESGNYDALMPYCGTFWVGT